MLKNISINDIGNTVQGMDCMTEARLVKVPTNIRASVPEYFMPRTNNPYDESCICYTYIFNRGDLLSEIRIENATSALVGVGISSKDSLLFTVDTTNINTKDWFKLFTTDDGSDGLKLFMCHFSIIYIHLYFSRPILVAPKVYTKHLLIEIPDPTQWSYGYRETITLVDSGREILLEYIAGTLRSRGEKKK